MTTDDARLRIRSAMEQFGPKAAPMIDRVINETRSALGNDQANDLIDEFNLELQYNICPVEFE